MVDKHFVELHGKRYDAKTGKLLSSQTPKRSAGKKSQAKHPSSKNIHRHVERSQTLMRHVVKKPKTVAKTTDLDLPTVKPHTVIDPKRLVRARHVHQSQRISKFGHFRPTVKATPAMLPVQAEPSAPPPFNPVHHEAPGPKKHRADFSDALNHAASHTEHRRKKLSRRHRVSQKLRVSPKLIDVTTATLAVMLLASVFAWHNAPRISMRLAATRSGVNGSLPGYHPAGFGLSGPIQYQPGRVTVTYKSHSDSRAFHISQRTSSLTSDSLRDDLKSKRTAYQTFSDKGKTIYIYDGSNATWIEGDTWYQIEGESALSSDQLLRLAASM